MSCQVTLRPNENETEHEKKIRARIERALYRSIVSLTGETINDDTRKEIDRRVNRICQHAHSLGWIDINRLAREADGIHAKQFN